MGDKLYLFTRQLIGYGWMDTSLVPETYDEASGKGLPLQHCVRRRQQRQRLQQSNLAEYNDVFRSRLRLLQGCIMYI